MRVTHYDDAITHVPPSILEYKHAGNELWFVNKNMDNVTKECPTQQDRMKTANALDLSCSIMVSGPMLTIWELKLEVFVIVASHQEL